MADGVQIKPGLVESRKKAFMNTDSKPVRPQNESSLTAMFRNTLNRFWPTSSDPPITEEYRFIMLGKTGSGKSSTGNTILGEELFVSDITLSSVTSQCELRQTKRNGIQIDILDCPGLYDTAKTQEEISITIVQAVACMHPGPHAILYIMRLTRFTAEEFGVYNTLKKLFDDRIVKYLIIIITGGDNLERSGKSLESLLENAPSDFQTVLTECNKRCVVFNNVSSKPRPQVDNLLRMVKEMVAKNNGEPYTCPKYTSVGTSLEDEVNRRLADVLKKDKEKEDYIKELEAKADAARKALEEKELEIKRKEEDRMRQDEMKHKEMDLEIKRLEKELQESKESRQRQDEMKKQMEEEIQKRIQKEFDRKREIDEAAEAEKRRLAEAEQEKLKLEKERMELAAKQQAEEEKRKTEMQEKLKRAMLEIKNQLEEERQREREREREELLQKERERQEREEEKRLAEKLERERKERAYREEMDRLKNSIAKREEPGWIEWTANGIGSAVSSSASWIKSWF